MHYYIGCTTDTELRYKASSGGLGSAIIKYLLSTGTFGTSMTFIFNRKECKYVPKLIYDFSDYNNCGSVYQDVDIIGFIKDNISSIKSDIVVTCMPCQVKAIRSILSKKGINCFIISLCCSGQTTVQGTWCYYRLLGINKDDVTCIQYRGNGWPSGIQIEMRDGTIIKRDNYTHPWTLMHESLLFRPQRCLACTFKSSKEADVTLADPWLKEYIGVDNIGNSVVICNQIGYSVVNDMFEKSLLNLKEVDKDTYIMSQLGTIQIKSQANRYRAFNKLVSKMGKDGSLYKRVACSSVFMMKLHLKILAFMSIILKR